MADGIETVKKGVGFGTDSTVGLTTEQMKLQASFFGFDFDTVWNISPDINNGYPYQPFIIPEIKVVDIENSKVSVTFAAPKSATVVIAFYNGERMVGLVQRQVAQAVRIENIDIPNGANKTKVLMLEDLSSMKPLCSGEMRIWNNISWINV